MNEYVGRDRNDFDYIYDVDSEENDCLVIYVFDIANDWEVPIDSMGGVNVEFDISDHGNVNLSPDGEAHIRNVAALMILDLVTPRD